MQLKRWLVLYPWMWSRSVIAGECEDKSMHQFNQEQSVLDLGFLPVGGTSRSGNQSITPPSGVGSAKDLPKRLFMGSLDDSNFELTEEGWSARYTDLYPGSYALLQYDRTRNHLASRFLASLYVSTRPWQMSSSPASTFCMKSSRSMISSYEASSESCSMTLIAFCFAVSILKNTVIAVF